VAVATSPTSTVREALEVDPARLRRGVLWRRIFTVLLTLFIAAALAGWFGMRSRTTSVTQGATSLQLKYAQITRRGVSAPWDLQIRERGGFAHDVEVEMPLKYLEILDVQEIQPQPTDETTTADVVRWTFSRPDGDTLRVRLDAQADPSAGAGRHRGEVHVRTNDRTSAALTFTTWMLP
jgi:hypothetical protein